MHFGLLKSRHTRRWSTKLYKKAHLIKRGELFISTNVAVQQPTSPNLFIHNPQLFRNRFVIIFDGLRFGFIIRKARANCWRRQIFSHGEVAFKVTFLIQ